MLTLTFLLIEPSNFLQFSSVTTFWKAEGLTIMLKFLKLFNIDKMNLPVFYEWMDHSQVSFDGYCKSGEYRTNLHYVGNRTSSGSKRFFRGGPKICDQQLGEIKNLY